MARREPPVTYTFTSDFPAPTGRRHTVIVSGLERSQDPEVLEQNAQRFVDVRAAAGVTAERE